MMTATTKHPTQRYQDKQWILWKYRNKKQSHMTQNLHGLTIAYGHGAVGDFIISEEITTLSELQK